MSYAQLLFALDSGCIVISLALLCSCQSADAQRETASQTIELIKVLPVNLFAYLECFP